MKAGIFAAGMGSRFQKAGWKTPKPLIPLKGKPLIAHLLDNLFQSGIDEVGIWQPHSLTWWIRDLSTGENRGFIYGTPSGIPLPADYNSDGMLDLAFWEPSQNTIFVSFDYGESNGATISVPPNSIPVYVNMY